MSGRLKLTHEILEVDRISRALSGLLSLAGKRPGFVIRGDQRVTNRKN